MAPHTRPWKLRIRALGAALLAWGSACAPTVFMLGEDWETDTTTGSASPGDAATSSTSSAGWDESSTWDTFRCDFPGSNEPDSLYDCNDLGCTPIDVLFVIDNSSGMGEAQRHLATRFRTLVDALKGLAYVDPNTNELSSAHASVNVMVTTTDMGHPLCRELQRFDYVPRSGAPVYHGCNARVNRFVGLGSDPENAYDACTENCPSDISPGDTFVAFDPFESNVLQNRVAEALSCIGPQGIDGCGYEAPLESMAQALAPSQCWNDPDAAPCRSHPEWEFANRPFLRDESILAIVFVTDGVECSVVNPDGFQWFTARDEYWQVDPRRGTRAPSEAICWNAGVDCDDLDRDGVYEDCHAIDTGVLHPVSRYTQLLADLRSGAMGGTPREVVMLGILGVPPVRERDPATQAATAGGVHDLVYRDWQDGDVEEGTGIITAADKRFALGPVAPGCTMLNEQGDVTGQAQPALRIIDVCQSLDGSEDRDDDGVAEARVRCCIESICAPDFEPAFECLVSAIQSSIPIPFSPIID